MLTHTESIDCSFSFEFLNIEESVIRAHANRGHTSAAQLTGSLCSNVRLFIYSFIHLFVWLSIHLFTFRCSITTLYNSMLIDSLGMCVFPPFLTFII